MKKYIGIEGNRLRMKAEMPVPMSTDFANEIEHKVKVRQWEQHLASLPVIEIVDFAVEIDREYVEDEDFEVQYQIYNADKWKPVALFIYDRYMGDNAGFKRVVALPISKQEASPKVESHTEKIKCPECNTVQNAIIEHTYPWFTYVHTCINCKYLICESEWTKAAPAAYHEEKEMVENQIAYLDKFIDFCNNVKQPYPPFGMETIARLYIEKVGLPTTPSPSPTIKSAEEIWGAACKQILADISEAYLDPKNLKKVCFNDSVVIMAIGEAIKNFPIPELASQFRDSEPSK